MFLVLFALLLVHCGADPHVDSGVRYQEPTPGSAWAVRMEFHGDTLFDPAERAEIETAARLWNIQTDGLLLLVVRWDLDVSSVDSLRALQDQNIIKKSYSTDAWVVSKQKEFTGGTMLGYMYQRNAASDIGTDSVVHIIVDSISGYHSNVTQIALHELGHAIGASHGGAKNSSVMWADAVPLPSVCLDEYDLSEFCRVHGVCAGHQMHPCR